MASVVKVPKKRPRKPQLTAGRLLFMFSLLGLPLVGAGLTYYFMDKFQSQRDLRIRGESAHVVRTSGGHLDVATVGVDQTLREASEQVCPAGKGRCRASETSKIRYQSQLIYSIRLPGNLVLEPRPNQKKYVVRIARPAVVRPATLTAVLLGARASDSGSREYGGSDATYQKLWAAIEQDLRAPATQARVDAQARATLGAFIQNWRKKNWEMGPIEAWPIEIVFEPVGTQGMLL
jgi:hypothetical protein